MKFQTVFVDNGSDYNLLKSIDPNNDLVKGRKIDKTKLVQKDVQYRTKTGMKTRKQWVKATEDKPNGGKKPSVYKEKEQNKPSDEHNQLKVAPMFMKLSDCGNQNMTPVDNRDVIVDVRKKFGKQASIYKPSPEVKKYLRSKYFVSQPYYDKKADKDKWPTTDGVYKKDGKYTPERQKLHDAIVKKIVDSATKPPAGVKPVAILMGGGSASGKGTVRSGIIMPKAAADGMTPGICDSDDIKNEMPEYELFKQQDIESAAYRVHDESSDICNEAIKACVKEGKNLLFDGTMKNYDKYSSIINMLHDNGYEVQIVGVDVPLEEAYKRSDSRAEHTGRTVPHSIIAGSHGGFALTLPDLVDLVDGSILYDNNNGRDVGPQPIMIDGQVINKEKYDTFIKKGQDHINNKRIAALSKNFKTSEDNIRQLISQGATIGEMESYYKTFGSDGWKELIS